MGRCGELGDELGSKIIATRLVHSIMRLSFLMEKEYAPYSKWFGTAFSKLKSGEVLNPTLQNVLFANNWKDREKHLSKAYEVIAKLHNQLKITKELPTKVKSFYDRPYLTIYGSKVFTAEILKQIKDEQVLNIKSPIGSVNQITNTVDLLENEKLLKRMKALYE